LRSRGNGVQPHVTVLEEHVLQPDAHTASVAATVKPAAALRGLRYRVNPQKTALLPQNTLRCTSIARCQRFHSRCIMHWFQTTRSSKEVSC
jgi:hypothetical protein